MTISNMIRECKIGMSQKLEFKTTCLGCGSREAYIYFDARYHGLRGACPLCETNWPES
jgi:hypothetical protein